MADTRRLPSTERLLELIDGMTGQPVVMVVDLVADRFVQGVPKRISREAPVLILSYQGERLAPGGGANAVANVAALGGRPLPLGIVGEDASGRELVAALAELGVETGGILSRPGYFQHRAAAGQSRSSLSSRTRRTHYRNGTHPCVE